MGACTEGKRYNGGSGYTLLIAIILRIIGNNDNRCVYIMFNRCAVQSVYNYYAHVDA